jgi:hypothetical protein
MDAHRPWFVKEPRLCLLFPLWKEFLEMPICLHIYRNPLEVAYSLKTRNAIPLLTGIALWEKYNVSAFNASRGFKRIVVSYNDILSNIEKTIDKLIADLSAFGVKGIRRPSNEESSSFIDDRYYRNVDTNDQCWEYLNKNQTSLYQSLLNESILENETEYDTSESSQIELNRYETNIIYIDELKKKISDSQDETAQSKNTLQIELDRYKNVICSLNNLIDLLFDDFNKLFNSKFWRCYRFITTAKYSLMLKSPPPKINDHIEQLGIQ